MKVGPGWVLCLVSTALPAAAAEVVFSAPREVREAVKQELIAQHFAPIDATAIDDALFNDPHCVKTRVSIGEYSFEPPARLPAEVRTDLRSGLAGCKARMAKHKQWNGEAVDCGAELVESVWERYIERVRPEHVIEIKDVEKTDTGYRLIGATYQVGDSALAIVQGRGETLETAVRKTVARLVGEKLEANGVRPSSDLLPGESPPRKPDLKMGVPQTQAPRPLEVPPGCVLPGLEIDPPDAPLAQTMVALWRATAVGHEAKNQPVLHCSLDLAGADGHPGELILGCASTVVTEEIFPATKFDDRAFQASTARMMLGTAINCQCHP